MTVKFDVIDTGSKGNCYALYIDDMLFLLEAGTSMYKIERYLNDHHKKVYDITACFISHSHKDHSKSVCNLMDAGVKCYMSDETEGSLYLGSRYRKIETYPAIVEVGDCLPVFRFDYIDVIPFPVVHDVYCSGFLLKDVKYQVVYMTDFSHSVYTFNGTTHFIIGLNYDEGTIRQADDMDNDQIKRITSSHASLEMVERLLRKNDQHRLEEVHLIHVSDRNANRDLIHKNIAGITGVPVYLH